MSALGRLVPHTQRPDLKHEEEPDLEVCNDDDDSKIKGTLRTIAKVVNTRMYRAIMDRYANLSARMPVHTEDSRVFSVGGTPYGLGII